MYVQHECVEVDSGFKGAGRKGVIQHVHQHGFPTSYVTPTSTRSCVVNTINTGRLDPFREGIRVLYSLHGS